MLTTEEIAKLTIAQAKFELLGKYMKRQIEWQLEFKKCVSGYLDLIQRLTRINSQQ